MLRKASAVVLTIEMSLRVSEDVGWYCWGIGGVSRVGSGFTEEAQDNWGGGEGL